MIERLNPFDEAARKAGFDIRKEYVPLLMTYRVVLSESSAKKVDEIIVENFADLRETHEKMVELVVATKEICRLLSGLHDASLSNGIRRNERISELIQIIGTIETNPLIKAAIEERENNG